MTFRLRLATTISANSFTGQDRSWIYSTQNETLIFSRADIGRMLLPGLMAENSRRWIASTGGTTTSGSMAFSPTSKGQEPLLELCNWFFGTTDIPPPLPGEMALAPTSQYFLPKMRSLPRASHPATPAAVPGFYCLSV